MITYQQQEYTLFEMAKLQKLFEKSVASFFHSVSGNDTSIPYIMGNKKYEILYKNYPKIPSITLPTPGLLKMSLEECLVERKSSRAFSGSTLSLEDISTLLYYGVGIKNSSPETRMYPSPGALYGLEIYFISRNVENKQLANRISHYNVKSHSLEVIKKTATATINSCFLPLNKTMSDNCSGLIVVTACFNRVFRKYIERGYRYAHLEAGHLAQNIYLVSTSLNIGCCGLGGYYDESINKLLDLDQDEKALYILAVGPKSK